MLNVTADSPLIPEVLRSPSIYNSLWKDFQKDENHRKYKTETDNEFRKFVGDKLWQILYILDNGLSDNINVWLKKEDRIKNYGDRIDAWKREEEKETEIEKRERTEVEVNYFLKAKEKKKNG
jgi:hypothetical protein